MTEVRMEINKYGDRFWYNQQDQLHREDGPSAEYANGTKSWFLNGQYHREDGPAIERADGAKFWFLNGKRHHEDGPSAEYANGTKEWWLNDQLHREDGPAIEDADGTKEWWLNGERLTEEEFNLIMGGKMEKVYIVEADDRYYDSGEQWTSTLAYEDIAEAEVEMMRMKKEYTGDKSNLCIKVVPIYIKKKGIPK